MSAMEYVHTTLMLVNDSRAYHPLEKDCVLRHLQDMAHDIMKCSWDVVPRWSQRVWDGVEKNNVSWAEDKVIPQPLCVYGHCWLG